MSGETLEVEVSALKRTGLDKLLEAISLQAELLDLQGQPGPLGRGRRHRGQARARARPGRHRAGPARHAARSATSSSPARPGGACAPSSTTAARPSAAAGPSVPVEILGFNSAPEAGDPFAVVESEGRAREITDYRVRKRRQTLGSAGTARTLEQMMQQLKETGRKEFPLVIKGDVQGSVEAIGGALRKLGTDEVEARMVHSGVGGITESDVALANASRPWWWASMCAPTRRPSSRPTRSASRSATTTSSTTWSTT